MNPDKDLLPRFKNNFTQPTPKKGCHQVSFTHFPSCNKIKPYDNDSRKVTPHQIVATKISMHFTRIQEYRKYLAGIFGTIATFLTILDIK